MTAESMGLRAIKGAFVDSVHHRAAFLARQRDDFVDHDLRRRFQPFASLASICSRCSGASASVVVKRATTTLSVASSQSD